MKTNLANFPFPNRPKVDYSVRLLTGAKFAVFSDIYALLLNFFVKNCLLLGK